MTPPRLVGCGATAGAQWLDRVVSPGTKGLKPDTLWG